MCNSKTIQDNFMNFPVENLEWCFCAINLNQSTKVTIPWQAYFFSQGPLICLRVNFYFFDIVKIMPYRIF